MNIELCNWGQHNVDSGFTIFMINGGRYKLHGHDGFCEIVIAWKGRFRHRLNGQLMTHHERDVLFIREQDQHEILGGDCEVINLPFTNDWLKRCEDFLRLPGSLKFFFGNHFPKLSIHESEWPGFRQKINHLMLHHNDPIRGRLYFSELLFNLIQEFYLSTPSASGTCDLPGWLNQLLATLNSTSSQDYSVNDLAELSGCSHEHLARSFRRYLNQTPSQYLNERRLQQAMQLLLCTNLRISDISYRIGIDKPSYFCRIFKEKYKVSPRDYREQRKVKTGS